MTRHRAGFISLSTTCVPRRKPQIRTVFTWEYHCEQTSSPNPSGTKSTERPSERQRNCSLMYVAGRPGKGCLRGRHERSVMFVKSARETSPPASDIRELAGISRRHSWLPRLMSQVGPLAGASPAGPLPLHPDQLVMVEPGRTLVPGTHGQGGLFIGCRRR